MGRRTKSLGDPPPWQGQFSNPQTPVSAEQAKLPESPLRRLRSPTLGPFSPVLQDTQLDYSRSPHEAPLGPVGGASPPRPRPLLPPRRPALLLGGSPRRQTPRGSRRNAEAAALLTRPSAPQNPDADGPPPKGVWEWGWGRGAVTSAAAALGPQLEPRRPSPRAASSSGPENEGRGGTAGGSAATNASPGARPGRAHVLRPDRLPRGRDAGSKKTQARGPTGSRVQEPLLSRPCAAPPSVAKGRGRAALPVNEAAAPAEGRVAVRPHDPPP